MKLIYRILDVYVYACLLFLAASCSSSLDDASPSFDGGGGGTGSGGSWARFTIIGDYLMTIDAQNLNIFDISNPDVPNKVNTIDIGERIETIYAAGDKLFIGSQIGMQIWDASNPTSPQRLAQTRHEDFIPCPQPDNVDFYDPIVVDDTIAYLTLKADVVCGGASENESQLIVFNVADVSRPFPIGQYRMDGPEGLGFWNNLLLVCDSDSLHIFDKSNPYSLVPTQSMDIQGYDVIVLGRSILITADDGFRQYEMVDGKPQYVSSILVGE